MDFDVIVVGSGAAGMTSALRAAKSGLEVAVLEKADHFGGTTALSGGGVWIPGSRQASAAGIEDSVDNARRYVLDVVGETADVSLIDAYLANGPEMVGWLEENTEVRFVLAPPMSDWYPEAPGAKANGRLLSPQEYDGKKLGRHFSELAPAREEFNAPGGFMIDLFDLPHIAQLPSARSLLHMGRLGLRFGLDRLRGYPRGARLTMGNALAARLLRSALAEDVVLRMGAPVQALLDEGRRITGVRLAGGETLGARCGVVLASGGFSANEQLRRAYMPFPEHHVSILPHHNTGDGMNMALDAGAALGGETHANGVWSVVSKLTRPDGYVARYAHLIDMSKPGCVAVDAQGERFGNEASVHFVEAMHASGAVPAHLVADAAFVKTYGLGMVFPGGGGLRKLVAAGYLFEAPTLGELAVRIGVDPDGLQRTADKVNQYAETGIDPDFGKGASEIDREMGDPRNRPNPCLGPIRQGPFYAVRIYPGDGSTTVGLKIDPHCRVLDDQGRPLLGLYAAGLDAHSIWRGRSPAHGCNVGPAMVLGYIAGKALAAEAEVAR